MGHSFFQYDIVAILVIWYYRNSLYHMKHMEGSVYIFDVKNSQALQFFINSKFNLFNVNQILVGTKRLCIEGWVYKKNCYLMCKKLICNKNNWNWQAGAPHGEMADRMTEVHFYFQFCFVLIFGCSSKQSWRLKNNASVKAHLTLNNLSHSFDFLIFFLTFWVAFAQLT